MTIEQSRPNSARVNVPTRRRRGLKAASVVAAATFVLAGCAPGGTEPGGAATDPAPRTNEPSSPSGVGTPVSALPTEPYVESDEVGEVPDHLPQRVAFANLGPAEIFTAWGDDLKATAESLGFEYITASAEFDPATNVEQMRSFITRGVGALFVIDMDVPSQRPVLCEAMQTGAAVFAVSMGPATTQFLADQYATGQAAAERAVDYVNENFDGQGNVLLFNQDDKEGIRPRAQAVRDVVEDADGISIVVDQLTQQETQEWGFEAMNTALQSNPEINAVIGPDDVVLGALAALQAAGADESQYALIGINGSDQALDAASDPESAFRATVAYALAPLGVMPARFAQYWLEGRAVPKVVTFTPKVLDSAESVAAFRADMADPAAIIGSPKQEEYFAMLGNISYETRGTYYNGTGTTAHGDDVDACDLTE